MKLKVFYGLMSVVLFVCGGFFIWSSFHAEPEHTPDIKKAEFASSSQKPVGPNDANIGKDKVTPATMKPNMVFIPSIKVYASIDQKTGMIEQKELMLPEASKVTRWSGGSNVIDKKGNIIVAGHVSWNGEPGALYNLAKTPLGAKVWISDSKRDVQGFQLTSKVPYKKVKLPKELWSTSGPKQLVIITCGGKLHLVDGAWHFDSNIVTKWKPLQ